jgi:hypothetical protein
MSDLERRLRQFPAEFPRPREAATRRTASRLVALAPRLRAARHGRSTIVLLAAALAIGVFVGAATNASGTDASTNAPGDPTIVARRYAIGGFRFVDLSGRIPTTAAGEVVQILERQCGAKELRIATDTQTTAGGFWSKTGIMFFHTTTYVARWNGRLSDEETVRAPLGAVPSRRPNRRWRVVVETRAQPMQGKPVVLQRRTSDERWVRVREARLRQSSIYGQYQATFAVPTRGLTLRVLVPQTTARPCYDAAASASWRS